ncbi:hypothetical protein WKW79_22695 [Variovorax robiniae]|uniref:Lipoprotein n=1 Tax=Variovorax robiniae TaxID=1836199 RepID=A0ABU8XCG5_9BURK
MNSLGVLARGWIVAAPCVLAGCAAMDGQGVGNGQYFQVLDKAGSVISESDAPKKGFQNCPNSAYEAMRSEPTLSGRVRCAVEPSRESLPYMFSARNTKSVGADQVLPTSAFVVRSRTAAICAAVLKATSAEEKVVILEDRCTVAAK